MEDPKFPKMNAFWIENEDEPGSFLIPVIEINGEQIIMQNIKKEKIDMFKHLAASMGASIGRPVYFTEYDKPSRIKLVKKPNLPVPQIAGLIAEIVTLLSDGMADAEFEIRRVNEKSTNDKEHLH